MSAIAVQLNEPMHLGYESGFRKERQPLSKAAHWHSNVMEGRGDGLKHLKLGCGVCDVLRRPELSAHVPIKPIVPGSGTVVPPPPQPPPMTLLSSVTAPFRAKALPQLMPAPVFIVMLVSARIFPANAVVVPRVAELPTCQNTFLS